MPDQLFRNRQKDGLKFHCPNGHSLVYGNSEKDKLKKKVARLEQELADWKDTYGYMRVRNECLEEELKHWQGQARGYKGQWARLKNKVRREAEVK